MWSFVLPLLVLALALQADAVVKSAVMNLLAVGDSASAPCSMGMGAMAAPRPVAIGRKEVDRKAPASHTPCSYCAAAAHVPILTTTAPVQPSCAVAFTAFRTASLRGPRGPPPVQPRARGPPRLT